MRNPLTARSVAALTVTLLPGLALAGPPHQKPGLWEIQTQSTILSDKAKFSAAQRPQLSPEAMARMKAMGIQMPQFNSDGSMTQSMTHKFCLTPQRDCKITNSSYSGNTFKADMVCDSPEMKGSGQVMMTMSSDKAYSGTMHFSGSGAHSGKMEMNNHITGHWLGADCGDTKPPQAAADAAERAAQLRERLGQVPPPTH
jgi:hypothetical protein